MPNTQFSRPIDLIFKAFEAAFQTAQNNVAAAKTLLAAQHHAQACSLSVLALEEVGKMMLIDGLLLAETAGERHKRYEDGHYRHSNKLETLEGVFYCINAWETADPRYSEDRYKQAVVISIRHIQQLREAICVNTDESFMFKHLDRIKQQGFYSEKNGSGYNSNQDNVSSDLAQSIIAFADKLIDLIQFTLKEAWVPYQETFKQVRGHLENDAATAESFNQIREELKSVI